MNTKYSCSQKLVFWRNRIVIFVVSMLMLLLSLISSATMQQAFAEEDEITASAVDNLSGVYTISSTANPNMVVDVQYGSSDIGAILHLWESNYSAAQRFVLTKTPDGYYMFRNVNSNLVLDVQYAEAYHGAAVWQHEDNGSAAQKWLIEENPDGGGGYKISSALDKRFCLGLASTVSANGTSVGLYQDSGTQEQRFAVESVNRTIADGVYTITSVAAKKAIDLTWASTENGTNIQTWSHNNTLAQRFYIVYDSTSGYYTVNSVVADRFLDVEGAGRDNGSNVQIYDFNGTGAQQWAINELTPGQFCLTTAHSGLALDVAGAQVADGANVQTYQQNNTDAQKWTFEARNLINNGVFQMRVALGTVLDAVGDGRYEGTNVWTYTANGSFAQKYFIEHASDGYFTIECLNSGLVIAQEGNNSNVILQGKRGAANQLWKPLIAGNHRFYLQNKATGLVLDVDGGRAEPGTNVKVHDINATLAQQWIFDYASTVPEGLYTIPLAASPNMVVDIAGGSRDNYAGVQLSFFAACPDF